MSIMLEAARKYLSRGWSVFPIERGTKKPAIPWKKFMTLRPHDTDLVAWFADDKYDIGIATGPISKLVVVDIDSDNPADYEKFINRSGPSYSVKTPHGYHVYFHYEGDDLRNTVKVINELTDTRAGGGYVVAAGSQGYAEIDGGTYRALPSELKAALQGYKLQTTDQPKTKLDAAELYNRVVSEGFTPGRHNEELKDVARYLFRMNNDVNLTVAIVSELNAKDPSPLPYDEMVSTIRSGIGYEQGRLAGKASEPARAQLAQVNSVKPDDVLESSLFGDMVNEYDDPDQQWLIEDWLPEKSVMVTAAPPESYKTWLGLEAAVNVSLGPEAKPFLGIWSGPNEGQPTLIVQQEDFMGLLVARIKTILSAKTRDTEYPMLEYPNEGLYSYGSALNAPLHIHRKAQLSLEDDASIVRLENKIKREGIKFVMIDPFYMLGRSDDYFASLALKMSIIKELRNKYGTTFMFIHHNKKNTKNGKLSDAGERENMFGSQLLNGSFEGLWLINSVNKTDKIIYRKGKVFPGEQSAYMLSFDIYTKEPEATDKFSLQIEPDGSATVLGIEETEYKDDRRYSVRTALVAQIDYDENEQKAVDLLTDTGVISVKSLTTNPDKNARLSKATAGNVIKRLLANNVIQVTPETEGNKTNKEYRFVVQF